MIFAHSGIADAPEWQVVNHRLEGAVVDHSIPRGRRVQDLFSYRLIFGEQIQTERAWPSVDEVDDFLNAAHFQDRQDRAKDLFLHRGRVRRHVHQHRWLDKTITSIMLAAVEDRSTFEKPHQPIKMMRADDPAVIRAFLRVVSIKFNQRFFQMFAKFRSDILKYEHVVRRGAGLTGIEPTPKGDATSRNSQIG